MACLLLLLPAQYALADLVFEPENDFLYRYRNHIIYLDRYFLANSEQGSAAIKKEPGAKLDLALLQNGETVYILYSCLFDGEYWGFSESHNGWANLGQFLVLYDYVAFEEEYLQEFYFYRGNYDEIIEAGAAVIWPWPGAAAPLYTVIDLDTANFRVRHAYMDEGGREWGFMEHMYSGSNIWLCLSDPLNRDLPAFNPAPAPQAWESETLHQDIKQLASSRQNESAALWIIIALVTALIAGTAILIRAIWKPKRQ